MSHRYQKCTEDAEQAFISTWHTEHHVTTATQDERSESVNSYVTNMLALEKHIQTALVGQIADLDEQAEIKGALIRIHAMCESHVRSLEAVTASREQNLGGVSKVLKKAASSVLGLGAAAVDFIRTEKSPKNLRDDYTALSLAYIGYVMLHTSALALGDEEVGKMAGVHMAAHAEALMSLQQLIPDATIAYLVAEEMNPDSSVLATVKATISQSWK